MSIYYVTRKHAEDGVITSLWAIESGKSEGLSLSKGSVIFSIALGNTFYTKPKTGEVARIYLVNGKTGKYLRTIADDEEEDNLDELEDY